MSLTGRIFMYQYNGDPGVREHEVDRFEHTAIPEKGTIVERLGRKWTVDLVNTSEPSESYRFPVVFVALSSVVAE